MADENMHLGYRGPNGFEVAACHAQVKREQMNRNRERTTCGNCKKTKRFRRV